VKDKTRNLCWISMDFVFFPLWTKKTMSFHLGDADPSSLIDIEDLVSGKNDWLNMYVTFR
jgi:hypothetical protein